MADVTDIMMELEAQGTEQHRKVYTRHGARPPMFGVSYAVLRPLGKRLGRDQALAEDLWATGNHDARVLAGMIMDPGEIDRSGVDRWIADVDNYVLTDSLTAPIAGSAVGLAAAYDLIGRAGEWEQALGWQILTNALLSSREFDDGQLEALAGRIESDISSAPNRARYSMNATLIAIGSRSDELEAAAIDTATRIGVVEVDHGETGCKTPFAPEYILKTRERRRVKEAGAASR
ncbi:DNA alkylation repair protein [bacterium]|nr:DNA alkylation repair protein [bacterium]